MDTPNAKLVAWMKGEGREKMLDLLDKDPYTCNKGDGPWNYFTDVIAKETTFYADFWHMCTFYRRRGTFKTNVAGMGPREVVVLMAAPWDSFSGVESKNLSIQ